MPMLLLLLEFMLLILEFILLFAEKQGIKPLSEITHLDTIIALIVLTIVFIAVQLFIIASLKSAFESGLASLESAISEVLSTNKKVHKAFASFRQTIKDAGNIKIGRGFNIVIGSIKNEPTINFGKSRK